MRLRYAISLVCMGLLSSSILYSSNELDKLIEEYNKKNNSSIETIDANRGHLLSYDRETLEKMHARSLKDILKTTPAIYYHENRYGIPDPLAGGSAIPNVSNFIRIFIDNVEVTQGWIGSGIVLYGDINLDFVDHIDLYYMAPSLDTSTESAYMTLFLYSKDPKQDGGLHTTLSYSDNGGHTESASYGAQTGKYSYMMNVSHTDAKHNKIDNGTDTPLSHDFERTQVFGYIKDDKQTFHLQVIEKNTDSLASLSWDATPDTSEIDYLNIHADYSIDITPNLHAQFTYEWMQNDIYFEDNHPAISYYIPYPYNDFISSAEYSTYTGEVSYRNNYGKHMITAGLKSRIRSLDSYTIEQIPDFDSLYDKEIINTLFYQDQYQINNHNLFSFGASYSHIERNEGVKSNTLSQFRLGYLYDDKHWNYKVYLYKNMYARDSLVASLYADPELKAQATYGLSQELGYTYNKHTTSLGILYMEDRDGLLNTNDKDTKYLYGLFRYNYTFNPDHKLDAWFYYAHYEDIFSYDTLEDWSGYLSLSDSFGDFDFFNSIIWHKNSIDNKNYFDLTSTFTWNVNHDFSITLKGENLLDKAKESTLFRIDPETMQEMTPLKIPVTDRRISIEMEYSF